MAAPTKFVVWVILFLSTSHDRQGHQFGVTIPSVFGSSDPQHLDPLVRDTLYGKVRGTLRNLHFLGGRQVERYLGVPYASPPVGDLRFEIPIPPKPWKGIKNVRSLPKACPQTDWALSYINMHVPEFQSRDMDEDCLYLNIYLPATTSQRKEEDGKRPVLIHVHGGSNEVGMGAMLDGDVLASLADVIVVTFNYRLGAFGFLSGGGDDFPGNYGLYDQTEAFRWVSHNIHHFGGDPDKVTIQGHSAGANDVSLHVISPVSKGLFRFAIIQSGSPLAYWAITSEARATTQRSLTRLVAGTMGCGPTRQSAQLKACLKAQTWQKINSGKLISGSVEWNRYAPVVDGKFIPLPPEQALKQLPLNGRAYMAGVTRDEGSLAAKSFMSYTKEKDPPFRVWQDIMHKYDSLFMNSFRDVPDLKHLIYHEYYPWMDPFNATANLIALSEVLGDSIFIAPTMQLADMLSRRSNDVYFYSFDHVSRLTKDPPWMGVPHGRDLFYLFGCPLSSHPLHYYTDLDKNVSRRLIQLWSNFIRHGQFFQTQDSTKEVFPTFETRNQSYTIIDSNGNDVTLQTGSRLRSRSVAFWNNLIPKLRGNSTDNGGVSNALTWVFVALTSVLLVVVFVLSICLTYFKNLARERCIVDASEEKT